MLKEDISAITNIVASVAFAGMTGMMLRGMTKAAVGKSTPDRLPQTQMVTVQCPICDKVIPIPGYNAVTRSDALKKHIEEEHTSRIGLAPATTPPNKITGKFQVLRADTTLVGGMAWETPMLELKHLYTGHIYYWISSTIEHKLGDIYGIGWGDILHLTAFYRLRKRLRDEYPDDYHLYRVTVHKHERKPSTFQPQALFIEGGEMMPSEYSDLVGLINEPIPEYSLMALPKVEPKPGEKKIDAVMRQLKKGVEGIVESDQFRLFLQTMSRFHDYSIGNQILIMLQRPDATRVAGFNTWKEMGRWVKSGEKGIAILAPIFPPRATCPSCGPRLPKGARFCPKCAETVDIEIDVSPRSFRVVHVFDVAQTEGKPLPEIEVPVLIGVVNEELFDNVLALMKKQGVTVSFESKPKLDPDIKGYYSPVENLIWVRPEEPRAQQLKTLLHEAAHYYSENVFGMPRAVAETIAESAAYVVGAHYGFDTGVRSFPYVAIWAEDKKVLEQNLAFIRRVATTMLGGLEA